MIETTRQDAPLSLGPNLPAALAPCTPAAATACLLGLTLPELTALLAAHGLATGHAGALYAAVFVHQATSFAAMTCLPASLRHACTAHFNLARPPLTQRLISQDGTRKYLFDAADGGRFEAVYIPRVGGSRSNTLCISSQTGCAVGCRFCFTASLTRHRDLSAAELVGQLLAVADDLRPLGAAAVVRNVVFMGMGEPLLNYHEVVQAARVFLQPSGLGLSRRRVTLSTAGIVPRIHQLGRELPLQLAVSLNASSDAVRSAIMPINKKWPLAVLIDALHAYPHAPRRRFTIEYVLLADVNDRPEDARRLPELLAGLPVQVNLLPLNPHDRTPYRAPSPGAVRAFQANLRAAGLHALVRTPRGQDIAAACGQLGVSGASAPSSLAG